MIIMPIYTQSTSHCAGNYAPSKMLCVVSTLIDIAISGLFLGVAYLAYVVFKDQEYILGFLLVFVDLLVLVLAIICFSETIDSYKELKDFAKEHKENKAIKERIARNKRLNSLESYDEFERLGITIVVITHEMSVIQEICDRVAIIDGGLIAEEGTVEEIFRNPKTKIGQELVLHEGTNREAYTGRLPYCYRLVFKGGSENEPVLGQMMIETKGLVNILAANTRTIDDEAFGQMVLQFPEEKELRETMIQYLKDRGVVVEEVEYV